MWQRINGIIILLILHVDACSVIMAAWLVVGICTHLTDGRHRGNLPALRLIAFSIAVLAAASLHAAPLASPLFDDPREEQIVLAVQQVEKSNFGRRESIHYYNTTRLANSLVMQRSDRKRLYDHNILLRAVFAGRVLLSDSSALGDLFSKSVFIDLGSGILFGEGAPTVRDIFEDRKIEPYLFEIVATDIEDESNPAARFITQYRKNPVLPFKVERIDMVMNRKEQWDSLLIRLSDDAYGGRPIILRGANSGPDLFYTHEEFVTHLDSLRKAWMNRHLLYLFNRFVLFKKKGSDRFTLLGEMDPNMGTAHVSEPWRYTDWPRRSLRQAFRPRPGRVTIGE